MKQNNEYTNILDYYYDVDYEYKKKYGDKVLILMEVGSFYEAYSSENKGCDIMKIANLLNVSYTKKDKKKGLSDRNPYMLGFPCPVLSKFLRLLINDNYTVVRMNQHGPKTKMTRSITQIYSPGTYIDESLTNDSNNIISIFIEELYDELKIQYCVGISVIDLSTGESSVYEAYSKIDDNNFPLDEIVRYLTSYRPNEIIINRIGNKFNKDQLLSYLELNNEDKIHYNENIQKNKLSKTYISEFFSKIYKHNGNVLEYLDIALLGYATASLIFSLEFAFEHNEKLIESIAKPIILDNNNYLILGNNAINQLNVLYGETSDKYKSLFDVVNNTSTSLGKRYLQKQLTNPIIDKENIEYRYNIISNLIENDLYKNIEQHLKNISDIQRLSRKLALNKINPYEFVIFFSSLEEVHKIVNLLDKKKFNKIIPKNIKNIEKFFKYINKTFNIDIMKKYNLDEIRESIFIKGKYTDIDDLENKINGNLVNINELANIISENIKSSDNKSNNVKNYIKVLHNERDGYHLQISKNKLKLFDQVMSKGITINNKNYNKNNFKIKELESSVKIYFSDNTTVNNNQVLEFQEKLITLLKEKCILEYNYINSNYEDLFNSINIFISKLDFFKSGAKTAKLYNYCKPIIETNIINGENKSFIKCSKLRHPIIERIRSDIDYVPHNVSLGKSNSNDIDGLLIYGLNSSGKSSLMKSIGLSVILAQIGYYVPADNYYYYPYNYLFARITGNDNIFKGLSSFALEMTELKAILNRSNINTLVIGDEVCRGTEHISGNAIVASTILKLSDIKCSFIFATHLHEIANMKRIKELNNVKAFHLTVEYDEKNDVLIFDRILKEGSGEPIYGYVVAKYIIQDNDFMKNVQDIKNELMNIPNTVVNEKKSKYNSKVLMSSCQVCNKTYNIKNLGKNEGVLDTHHINFQSECKNGFVNKDGKKHIKMNNKSNLVVLCKECHYNVHNNKLTINGYKDTSNGRVLDFKIL